MGVLDRKKVAVSDGKLVPELHQSAESIHIRTRESSVESAGRPNTIQPPSGYRAFFSRPGQKAESRFLDDFQGQKSRYSKFGTKKQRRHDNYRSLLALKEEDEELTVQGIDNSNKSAFSSLFENQIKMETWNDFLACSEEEQETILTSQGIWIDDLDQLGLHAIQVAERSGALPTKDMRRTHPGYSSMEAYDGLNSKLKTVLKRRQLPLGTLWYLEEEITQFFLTSPRGTVTMEIGCSFDRLLLHAVCQFHLLTSMSFPLDEKRRGTIIKNRFQSFQVPDMSLGSYVEMKFGKKRSLS